MPLEWVVVVPVKELQLAKTRLGFLTQEQRADLALAFARDVVAAARACPAVIGVYAVTNDVRAAAELTADGARVIADSADSGLNPALRDGARTAAGWHPRAGVAALSSDLPALSANELGLALEACSAFGRAFVADHAGTGTVLLAATAGASLEPAFGNTSRDLHRASGAVEVAGDWPGLRADVDTKADLDRISRLPVGRHTARVLALLGSAG